MKKFYIAIICIISVVFTGCMKEYPLTDTQTDIVAEYMASTILQNDKKFSPTLLSYYEITNKDESIPVEEQRPEPNEIPGSNHKNEDDISSSDANGDGYYTLSEVIGEPSFDILYTSYQFADTYPEDDSNLVFSIDPRPGYQLLVVNFLIENITDKDEIIDLSKAKVQYQLDVNVGTIYKPQLALIENNMQYINLNVKSGSKIPAVLIFEVSKDIDMSDINLIVSRDRMTEIVEIK